MKSHFENFLTSSAQTACASLDLASSPVGFGSDDPPVTRRRKFRRRMTDARITGCTHKLASISRDCDSLQIMLLSAKVWVPANGESSTSTRTHHTPAPAPAPAHERTQALARTRKHRLPRPLLDRRPPAGSLRLLLSCHSRSRPCSRGPLASACAALPLRR
jgi:hypothetical protein